MTGGNGVDYIFTYYSEMILFVSFYVMEIDNFVGWSKPIITPLREGQFSITHQNAATLNTVSLPHKNTHSLKSLMIGWCGVVTLIMMSMVPGGGNMTWPNDVIIIIMSSSYS